MPRSCWLRTKRARAIINSPPPLCGVLSAQTSQCWSHLEIGAMAPASATQHCASTPQWNASACPPSVQPPLACCKARLTRTGRRPCAAASCPRTEAAPAFTKPSTCRGGGWSTLTSAQMSPEQLPRAAPTADVPLLPPPQAHRPGAPGCPLALQARCSKTAPTVLPSAPPPAAAPSPPAAWRRLPDATWQRPIGRCQGVGGSGHLLRVGRR